MLAVNWMLFQGSWAQTRINWEVEAPVTGAPMAVVYFAGVVFAVPAALLLLVQLWRTATGRLHDCELVMVPASEGLAHTSSPATPAPDKPNHKLGDASDGAAQ